MNVYAGIDKTFTYAIPKPETLNLPVVVASDGNYYAYGRLKGDTGILRIRSDGYCDYFHNIEEGDLLRDYSGDFLYVKRGDNITKISVSDGKRISDITVNPSPESYTNPPVAGVQGNLYCSGVLNGVHGILKIEENGNLNMFAAINYGELLMDFHGEVLYVHTDSGFSGVSLDTGKIVNEISAVVLPFNSNHNPVSCNDGNIYIVASIDGINGIYIVSPAGEINLFYKCATESIIQDIEGKNLMSVEVLADNSPVTGTVEKNEVAPAIITGSNNIAIVKYAVTVEGYSGVRAYPNPFRSDKDHSWIRFDGLTEETDLKIFNLAGELVFEKDNIDLGAYTWDVKNTDDRDLASGVYICLFTNKKAKDKTKKISILR